MAIEIWCKCGEGLCSLTVTTDKGIIAEPCPECIRKAYESGYNTGYDKAENRYEGGDNIFDVSP